MQHKSILFVIPSYTIGGVTSSLSAFISQLDRKQIEVNLFCLNQEGPMKETFESMCKILPENIWLSDNIVSGSFWEKTCCRIIRKLNGFMGKIGFTLYPILGRIGGEQLNTNSYDAVVSFQESLNPRVCYYPASKRIAWIHCDYKMYKATVGKNELKEYELYDKIICVSNYAKSIFSGIYPILAERVDVLHNIVDVRKVKKLSSYSNEIDNRYDNSCFTIVSIGRLDPVKQFEKIPSIAAEIRNKSVTPFKWYIIGGNRGYAEIENQIQTDINRLDLKNVVYLLGEKRNVYPYLAKSNLFVCTSMSESFPMVILEAKVFNIPIVSNSFPSVYETMTDGVDGRIVPLKNMAEIISKMFLHPSIVKEDCFDQETVINKFHRLLLD